MVSGAWYNTVPIPELLLLNAHNAHTQHIHTSSHWTTRAPPPQLFASGKIKGEDDSLYLADRRADEVLAQLRQVPTFR